MASNEADKLVQVGRLAMRREGESWVAYYALPDTMVEPIFLGSIRLGAVTDRHLARRDAFMNMMRDVIADILEEQTGVRPVWGEPQSAPENERSGSS
jgi:hypothetical protein